MSILSNIKEYTKRTWKNGKIGKTAVSAAPMNNIEEGIYLNRELIKALNANNPIRSIDFDENGYILIGRSDESAMEYKDTGLVPKSLLSIGTVQEFFQSRDWNDYRKSGFYRFDPIGAGFYEHEPDVPSYGQVIISHENDTTLQIACGFGSVSRIGYRCFNDNLTDGAEWKYLEPTNQWIDMLPLCQIHVITTTDGIYKSYLRYNPATKQLIGCIETEDTVANQAPIITLPEGYSGAYDGICGITNFHDLSNDGFQVDVRIQGREIISSHTRGMHTNKRLTYMINTILA